MTDSDFSDFTASDLEILRLLAASPAPGGDWLLAAGQPGEVGRANRRVLLRAMRAYHQGPYNRYWITRIGDTTRLARTQGALDLAESTTVDLPGGAASWASRDNDGPSGVEYVGAAPTWLRELLGGAVVERLSRGTEEFFADETLAAELLGRYALGLWLHRWHPSGPRRQPFAEGALRVELGVLAWRASDLLGSTSAATEWLRGTADEIVALALRVHSWTGWRRALADGVLQDACQAYLALFPSTPEADEIRRLAEAIRDTADLAPFWATLAPLTRDDLALVASTISLGDQAVEFAVDAAAVPPRSVSASRMNAVVEVADGERATEIRILVSPGDQPVAGLAATLIVDGERHTIELPRWEGGYVGVLEMFSEPGRIEIHVHELGYAGPLRSPVAVQTTREYIDAVLSARQATYDAISGEGEEIRGLSSVPFVAEILGWRDEL